MVPINDYGTHNDRNDDEVHLINEFSTHYVRKYDHDDDNSSNNVRNINVHDDTDICYC